MYENLTVLAMAQKSMDWLSRRQEVVAENVANANTPNYKAKDLAPLDFAKALNQASGPAAMRAVVTNPMHISPEIASASFEAVTDDAPSESKPNGNTVSLEQQMEKMGDVKGKYELAANLLAKNVTLLKLALDKGGV